MTNDLSLPLSTVNESVENPAITNYQSSIRENDSAMLVSQNHEQKPSSSYLTLSVGDNRHFGFSDFQDPLFWKQPLHFHYNQPVSSTIGSGHETGDRAGLTNEIKFNECRKESISSRQHGIEKSKSTHRRYANSKKGQDKMIKAKEKKKKVSKENMNKRKHKNKKLCRSNIQQVRYQSKTCQALLLKRRRRQQMLLKKNKKLLKQRMVSKKMSIPKGNKKKSLTSSQHTRKLNTTNNRVVSSISPRRSLTSRPTRAHSITQSKTGTTVMRSSSMIHLINNSKTETVPKRIKHRTGISILDPVSQLTTEQRMNATKHLIPTPSNILSSSCVYQTIASKPSSRIRREQNLSNKNLLCSKSNVQKLSRSKSKQIKQRNRGSTKLNIRSPVHTTFKKNVRRYRKRRSTGRKKKFPKCTSKTLIKIAPINTNDENLIHRKTSPLLFLLKNSLTDKQSSTSTVMPLTKNSAQLTSKNNNRRTLKIKRQGSDTISKISGRILKEPTRAGMTLRSRTIIINNMHSTRRKDRKYK